MNEIVKICKIHGQLTLDKTRKDKDKFRCKVCRNETNKKTYYKHREKRVSTSMRWKRENKGDYAEWCRLDRIKNPEKYRRYEQNSIRKHGIEKFRKQEVARIHGITVEDYEKLIKENNNQCFICKNPETRKGRNGKSIAMLCIDHCHICEEKGKHIIRGLLCHACNTAIGKFGDNVEYMKKAIEYLEKHNHTEELK